jgi:hypothetical protein
MWQNALIVVLILVLTYFLYVYKPWKTKVLTGEKGSPYKILDSKPATAADAAKGVIITSSEPVYFPHGYEIKIAEVKTTVV